MVATEENGKKARVGYGYTGSDHFLIQVDRERVTDMRSKKIILKILAGLISILISPSIIFLLISLFLKWFNISDPPIPGERDLGRNLLAGGAMIGGILFGIPLSISFAVFLYQKIIKILDNILQFFYRPWTRKGIAGFSQDYSAISVKDSKSKIVINFIISLMRKLLSSAISLCITLIFVICMIYVMMEAPPYFFRIGRMASFVGWLIIFISWLSLVFTFPIILFLYKKLNKLFGEKNDK